jgi:formylglycine-generating enzyme required for sulfatase activity
MNCKQPPILCLVAGLALLLTVSPLSAAEFGHATVAIKTAQAHPEAEENPGAQWPDEADTTDIQQLRKNTPAGMVFIPAGSFMMGSPLGEGRKDEHPQHRVNLDHFYMDAYEVTNAKYKEFCDATGNPYPAATSGWDENYFLDYPDHPVINVSWHDAVAYAAWAGKRLPTEAEWEYACRAGTEAGFAVGSNLDHDYVNYSGEEGRDRWERTSPVGSFPSNEWGLFDMHGNVQEWCSDFYNERYYTDSPTDNPKGPELGYYRVLRGGSYKTRNTEYLRPAQRSFYSPSDRADTIGFRCVKDI